MRNIYRKTVAAVAAAMMIASPLCCCSLAEAAPESGPETGPELSCCSHEVPAGHGCPGGPSCPDCRVKNLPLAEAGKAAVLKVVLPDLAPLSLFAVVPVLTAGAPAAIPAMDRPDPGPPGWRQVLHQTFLI